MQDRLEPLQRGRIAEDLAAQGDAVDGAVLQHPGEGAATSATARPAAAEQAMDGLVGVVDRDAQAAELAAAVDLPMPIEPVRPRMIIGGGSRREHEIAQRRRHLGLAPNQAAKPGRA